MHRNRNRPRLTYALILAALIYAALDSAAATQASNVIAEVGISGQVITTTDTAQFLTVPLGAMHASIAIMNADACFGHDISGAAPTTTSSDRWFSGMKVILANDPLMLKRLRVISCSAGVPSTVQIYYSRARRVGDAQ